MPIFEVTAPDGRSLEIEGEKAPSLDELNEIFSSIPVAEKVSTNQSALKNIKSTDDEPEVGASIADRFNKLQKDSEQYLTNLPRKEEGMSWIEYAKLRKKYDEDWGIESFELNPLKHMWKTSVVGIASKVASDLHRKQKEVRAKKYTDNTEVLSEIPEEAYHEWDEKGEIKAGEAFMRSDWAKAVPFFGSVEGLNETFDIKSIVDKKNKGEDLSKKEIERLNAYILDVAEQNRRGISFGGKLIQGALELPSFAGEFMATGGVASIGKTAVQKTITKGLQDATQKEIGKRLTKGLIETAAGATTRVSIGMPQRVADNYGMRKLHDSLGISDKGQVVLETADEAPALTFMKAWGDTVIEAWSEEMGGGLAEAAGLGAKTVSKFTSPVAEKLFSRNTRAAFIKAMRKMRPNATVKDVMTRAGFNGILGEMGEERAGDVLRVVFGIDDREDISTFDKLCEAIAPDKEELLLELGLFSIPSSMSFAASRVAGHLRKQNVKEEDISDYMRLTSELEKEKFLGDIAEKHDLEAIEKFEENVRTLKNRYYTQNLNAGIEKEEALATAEIEANAVSSLAKNIGMDINELNEEFAINLQSMTTEEAKAQREQDIKVLQGGVEMEVEADMPKFQSAMYKAPQENFADFYNQVFIKEQESKENNTVIKKSYFEYKNDDIQVRIKHDAINHTENKHQLTSDEWNNVLENLTNIEKAEISKETFSNDKVALVKINTPMGKYGVAIQFANGKNYIATAFKSTDKGINAWMKKSSAKTLSNNPIATLEDKSSESDVILGQNSNNIINDVKAKLKPNQRIFYQTDSYSDIARQNIEANFGESIEDLTSMVRSDVENVLFENVIDESEFKIEKIRMNGSYTTGKNKKSSDLDFLLEYTGTMREDDAFNMFAEAKLKITDYKGKRVKIDINPIKAEKSGTIADRLNAVSNIYYQSAYHGTPHRFDEFSTEHIGSGEGAQAHGWGLYFAEDRNVSEEYRKKLIPQQFDNIGAQIKVLKSSGDIIYTKKATNTYNYTEDGIFEKRPDDYLNTALLYIEKTGNDKEKAIEKVQKKLDDYKEVSDISNARYYLEVKEILQAYDFEIVYTPEEAGQLFEVDIPENDVLLDENKSIDEQPLKVKKVIQKYFNNAPEEELKQVLDFLGIKTGKDFYNNVANNEFDKFENGKFENDIIPSSWDNLGKYKFELASKRLNKLGIKGITYNGKSDGRCYVIFDDKAIDVLKTYYQSEGEGNIDNARGFTYQRFNFDGTTKDNLIVLLKNKSDKTTLLHEFAHVYLTTLNNLALRNDRAKELLLTVNKWLNYNGVEYTAKQHEKFANGFVAYVKAGKAPTYGLKRAFENFKRWLNDMYNELTLNDGIEFDDYTKEVFDELLGNSSNTAKNELIVDLINRAKNNANLRIREEQIDSNNKIKVNELTDSQRRYRDVAYEILYSAAKNMKDEEGNPLVTDIREMYMLFGDSTSYKKNNKGVKHRREKFETALLQADDVFSAGDGFQAHWGEFFFDTGISYDNMEVGADAELISQALEVITEKRYLYASDSLFNPNEVTEEDLKKSKYELDYILEEYKYNKYERDLTVAAFFEWVDSVHPYIIDDIILEWENKTNEIDRYENLNEFQKAKEDLKIKAATLKGYGDYSTQFAEYAREIIKRLNFMTEHDKMKIFDKLKDYNSFREIERNLDSVMDYAETLNDVTLRKNLAETIIKEVKRTVPEKVNGTKKTKYDYRTNKLFERLRFLEKMSQEEIKNIYDAYVNDELERRTSQFNEAGTITGKTETFFEDIENSFIQFKANGIYYNSTEMLQTLLDKIQNAKFTGKIARDEADFQLRMEKENWINQCAQALESHRGNVGKLEELYSMEANLDSIMGMIFDDNIKNKFSLDDLYAQVDGRVGADREEVLNKIANVFEYQGVLKGVKLNNKFIEMANEKYTIRQRYAKKEDTDSLGVWQWETIELSKMEILYYYIQAKNPTSYEMLTDMGTETRAPKGQFDRFEFNELLNNLSDQEKLVGDILQLAAEKYYNDLNKYHIRKHHIDMGKVNCYFPRKSELNEVNELDLFNQYTEKSTNPKFVKIRTAGPSIRIAPANPINVLFNHIQKANTIIIMGEQLDLINKVFRDNDLKQKITSVFGEKVYTEFMQHIAENLYSGQTKTLSNAEGILSKLMSNIIGAPMFIKPQVGIKQILGLINYGIGDEYVGTLEWGKAFRKVIKSPREAIDFMMQDEYLKDRLTRANMNEAMKKQIENKLNSRMSLLTDYFSLNMRLGDLLNLTLGGRAYIDVLLKKGYSKDQAFALFRKKTLSDQQSSIPSTLSNMQRNSKDNPFARLLFAYQNTPHQYFRICANAIIKLKQGKLDKKKAFKTIFVYWYLLPLIFNMAGSLSPITFLATGDPSEIFTDMKISCLGSISCIPFFGEMARALFCGITGEDYFGNRDWFSRANNAIVKPIKKMKEGDLSLEDIIKSLEVFAQGAGIPLEEINTQIEAFGDYASGNYEEGFLKTLGYSRYRAKTVTGNN